MNFIYKCMLQHILSISPGGGEINYFLQRFITRSLPLSDSDFGERVKFTKFFLDSYIKYSAVKPEFSTCFEFSSGTHLQNPIGLSLSGFKKIYTADIESIGRAMLLNDIINKYSDLGEYSLPTGIPPITKKNMREILSDFFNIEYLAPVQITELNLPYSGIHFINSRTTLEHIPNEDLPAIINYCYKILHADGIIIFLIDYRDHWSYFDPNISVFNFLKYSDAAWKIYNPKIHHQNRLRHIDYRRIFRESNFHILEEFKQPPDQTQNNQFAKSEIDPVFLNHYSEDDLKSLWGTFILKK